MVPLRMGGKGFFEKAEDKFEGFVENVEDKIEGFVEGVEDKITEAAEDKIKEAIENQIKALVANTGEDSEHKSAGWGGEGSGPDTRNGSWRRSRRSWRGVARRSPGG